MNDIDSEIETLKKQKDSLHDLLEQNVYDTNTFLERSKKLNEKIKKLEENKFNIESELKSFKNQNIIIPKITKLINSYDKISIKDKNEMLKTILIRVEYLKKEKALKKNASHNVDLKLFPRI